MRHDLLLRDHQLKPGATRVSYEPELVGELIVDKSRLVAQTSWRMWEQELPCILIINASRCES